MMRRQTAFLWGKNTQYPFFRLVPVLCKVTVVDFWCRIPDYTQLQLLGLVTIANHFVCFHCLHATYI